MSRYQIQCPGFATENRSRMQYYETGVKHPPRRKVMEEFIWQGLGFTHPKIPEDIS